jgi:hypothetical protein
VLKSGSPPSVLEESSMTEKPRAIRPGVVEKIIKPLNPKDPEKAQIVIEGADHLYKEIRIENALEDDQGNKVKLKEHAHVDVVVEAKPEATVPDEAR